MDGEKVKHLHGASENYTIVDKGNQVELIIDTDDFGDFEEFFNEAWPKAFTLLKEICE